MIVGSNVKESKETHQNSNAIKDSTKAAERNENYTLTESRIKPIIRHDYKAFSRCTSWCNFLAFKSLSSHEQGAPHFEAREE